MLVFIFIIDCFYCLYILYFILLIGDKGYIFNIYCWLIYNKEEVK